MASTDGWHYDFPWAAVPQTDHRNDNTMWVSHTTGMVKPIEDMDDEHLKRSIGMITRGRDSYGVIVPEWCSAKYSYLIKEAERRRLEGYNNGWDE